MTEPEQEIQAPLVAQSADERAQIVENSYDVAFGSAPADPESGYLGEDLVNAAKHLHEQNAAEQATPAEGGLLDDLQGFGQSVADTAHGVIEHVEHEASSAWESVKHAEGDAEQYLNEESQDLIHEAQHGIADM